MTDDLTNSQPTHSNLRIRKSGGGISQPPLHRASDARATIRIPTLLHSTPLSDPDPGEAGSDIQPTATGIDVARAGAGDSVEVARRSPPIPQPSGTSESEDESESSNPDSRVAGGKSTPSEADRANARKLFRAIGKRFNENRKKSKSSAYEQYQRDLMENMDTLLLGGVIELKEITATVTNLEVFMKSDISETGKSQSEMLAEWLRIDPSELSPKSALPSPPPREKS